MFIQFKYLLLIINLCLIYVQSTPLLTEFTNSNVTTELSKPIYTSILSTLSTSTLTPSTTTTSTTSRRISTTVTPSPSSSSSSSVANKKATKLENRILNECFGDENEMNNVDQKENFKSLIRGLYKFSINLFKSIHNFESRDQSSGLLLSPFSIWSTLVIAYIGANSDTDRELRNVLGVKNIGKKDLAMALKQFRPSKDFNFSYSIANRLYFNENLNMKKCIKDNFINEFQSIDFARNPVNATNVINKWVENETNKKIVDLIPSGLINSFTNLIIVNAIYFQSKWLNQFDPSKNELRKFHISPTEEEPVQMMTSTGNYMYTISERLQSQIIEIPYTSGQYSMLIILPDLTKGVDSLIRSLNVNDLDEIINNLYEDEINLIIPRFKFEQEFDLSGPLYSIGIKKLFDPRYSDLSGFFEDINNKTNIIVNSVVHKSFITVNEQGTEAAASTTLLIARSGRPAFPTKFIADHPFVYLIRETSTNVILFIGVVRRPTE